MAGFDGRVLRQGSWTDAPAEELLRVVTGLRTAALRDGVDRTGPMGMPNTGWWQVWQTVTKTGVPLAAGAHVVRLVLDTGTSATGGCGNFNWMRFVAS